MKGRLNLGGWSFYIGLSHSKRVEGVNSKLPDGKHFLMWDFDDVVEGDVRQTLRYVQKRFKLPKIYLVNTGLAHYWHAYCFKRHSFADTLHILASTPFLDRIYFLIGVSRGYFTLRYVPKGTRDFKPAVILTSKYPEDVDPYTECCFIRYWTKRVG